MRPCWVLHEPEGPPRTCSSLFSRARGRRADAMAVGVLFDSAGDRTEDLLRRGAAGHATLYAAARVGAWTRSGAARAPGQLSVAVQRSAVCRLAAVFAARGGRLHAVLSAVGLSDGVGDCTSRARAPSPVADGNHPAVLDLLPAARVCLDRPAAG